MISLSCLGSKFRMKGKEEYAGWFLTSNSHPHIEGKLLYSFFLYILLY
jgi:hypothetical protein